MAGFNLRDLGQSLSFLGTVGGSLLEAKSHRKAADAALSASSRNTKIIDLNTNSQLKALSRGFERIRGNQIAAMGASGVSVDSKSFDKITSETFDNFSQDAMDIIQIGDMQKSAEIFRGESEAFKQRSKARSADIRNVVRVGKNLGGLGSLFKKEKTEQESVNEVFDVALPHASGQGRVFSA